MITHPKMALSFVRFHFAGRMLWHPPITQIEKSFHLEHGFIRKHILKSADLDAITEAAFKSRLGMRAINSKIKEQVNNYIFDNYKKIYPDRIAEYKSTL